MTKITAEDYRCPACGSADLRRIAVDTHAKLRGKRDPVWECNKCQHRALGSALEQEVRRRRLRED